MFSGGIQKQRRAVMGEITQELLKIRQTRNIILLITRQLLDLFCW